MPDITPEELRALRCSSSASDLINGVDRAADEIAELTEMLLLCSTHTGNTCDLVQHVPEVIRLRFEGKQNLITAQGQSNASLRLRIAELEQWKAAVEEAAVVNWTLNESNANDPRKAISDLIGCIMREAMDPMLSQPAAELQARIVELEQQVADNEARRERIAGKPEAFAEALFDIAHEMGLSLVSSECPAAFIQQRVENWRSESQAMENLVATRTAELHEQERMVRHLLADGERLDWLADPNQGIGNVQLPNDCVLDNMHSLRDAIDAAMKLDAARPTKHE